MNKFWKDTLERALWTMVQAATSVAVIGLGAGANVDWKNIAITAGVASLSAGLSFLKSLAKERLGNQE